MYFNKNVMKNYIKERKNAYIAAGITIGILLIIFYINNMLLGEKTIVYSDLEAQYIPMIKSFWRAVFTDETIKYSFSMGLGMPSIAPYAWSALSPINFLYVLITDYSIASIFVVAIKFGLTAYCFSRLMKKQFKQTGVETIIFACCYALCGHAINFYCNIHFLDGMYMLPVIVGLVLDVIKTGKWHKLAIAYAYIFIVQFYEGFLIGIFSFLFFALEIAFSNKGETNGKFIFRYFIAVIVAILLSAVVILPTAYYYLNHLAEDSSIWGSVSLDGLKIVRNLFLGIPISVNEESPAIYSGVLCLLILPLYFESKRISIKEKIKIGIIIAILVAGCFITPLYYFLHMFNDPDGFDYRFSFLLSFMLCLIGCRGIERLFSGKRIIKILVTFIIAGIFWGATNTQDDNYSISILIINVVVIVSYLIFSLIKNAQIQQIGILLLSCIELIVNGVFCTGRIECTPPSMVHNTINYKEIIDLYNSGDQRLTSNLFANAPGFYGYMGISLFSSFENCLVRDTMKRLGYGTSTRAIYGTGDTETTKCLLGVKNSLDFINNQPTAEQTNNYKNEVVLPLAYMVSTETKDFNLDNYDVPQNINKIASIMCGESVTPLNQYDGEIEEISSNVHFERVSFDERVSINNTVTVNPGDYDTLLLENLNEPGYYQYVLSRTDNCKIYAFFELDESFALEGGPLVLCEIGEKHYDYPYVHISRMIPLNDTARPTVGVYFNNPQYGIAAFRKVSFVSENEDEIARMYSILSQGAAQNFNRAGDRITFDIECSEGKEVLFTSIPYEEGWHIKVDGKEVPIIKLVNETFLGAKLTPGFHQVELNYSPLANKLGAWLSILGVVMLIFGYYRTQRMDTKN